MGVAVIADRRTAHQFHGKPSTTCLGGAGIDDTRDAVVLHHGERLALDLEALGDVARRQFRANDLERYPPVIGFGLLGSVHDAHATLAKNAPDSARQRIESRRAAAGENNSLHGHEPSTHAMLRGAGLQASVSGNGGLKVLANGGLPSRHGTTDGVKFKVRQRTELRPAGNRFEICRRDRLDASGNA